MPKAKPDDVRTPMNPPNQTIPTKEDLQKIAAAQRALGDQGKRVSIPLSDKPSGSWLLPAFNPAKRYG